MATQYLIRERESGHYLGLVHDCEGGGWTWRPSTRGASLFSEAEARAMVSEAPLACDAVEDYEPISGEEVMGRMVDGAPPLGDPEGTR